MKKYITLMVLTSLAFAIPGYAQKLHISAFGGLSRPYLPYIERADHSILQSHDGTSTTWYTTITKEDYANDFGAKAGVGLSYQFSPKIGLVYEGGLQNASFTRMLNREFYQTQDLAEKPSMYDLESVNSTAKLFYLTQTVGGSLKLLSKLQLEAGLQANYVIHASQSGFSFWHEGQHPGTTTVKGSEGINTLQLGIQAAISYTLWDDISLKLQYQRGISGMFTEDNQFAGNTRYQGASLLMSYIFWKK